MQVRVQYYFLATSWFLKDSCCKRSPGVYFFPSNTAIHKSMVCFTGLEFFCDDPVLVKTVESQTCSKIFAVEILEKSDIPLLVLYDTSGEDDININATCLKALYDKSLELHLKVPSSCFLLNSLKKSLTAKVLDGQKTVLRKFAKFLCMFFSPFLVQISLLQVDALYTNVRVTTVFSDGSLCCQVPSKGLSRLSEILQKLEDYFHYKVGSVMREVVKSCSLSSECTHYFPCT